MSSYRPTRREVCQAVRRLPRALPVQREGIVAGFALGEALHLRPSDRHLLEVLAGESDSEAWALPARAEDLVGRWSARVLAKLVGCSSRTVWRCLARLEAVDLVVRERAGWLPARYVLAAEQLVTTSAEWVQTQAQAAIERAQSWVAQRPTELQAQGAAAAQRLRQAEALTPQELAAAAPAVAIPLPAADAPLEAWIPWALGQADALLRSRGVPSWAQTRACKRPVEFARLALAWAALRRRGKGSDHWWSHAQGHARQLWPHWRAVQERPDALESLLWSLLLVLWAHEAGAVQEVTTDRVGRTRRRQLRLDEWLRTRPTRWEAALLQAEAAWAAARGAAQHPAEEQLAEEQLAEEHPLVQEVLCNLPAFRASLQGVVHQALALPAGRFRSSSLRANLKLLAEVPSGAPQHWVRVCVQAALRQRDELRAWVQAQAPPDG